MLGQPKAVVADSLWIVKRLYTSHQLCQQVVLVGSNTGEN